ncbi:MAG: AEC family transporter [Oscillospiraceae bacterium]|nr:AEC family transporter [Oscillospiraceae bacterium]
MEDMAIVVLRQAFIMLMLILVGAGCFKLKLLTKQTVTELSGLVLKVVNPIVILMAYQRENKPELVHNLGWTFLLTVIAYLVACAVAYLGIRDKEGRETVIERFSSIYSNCGFMGIPLVMAMFGYEGVFYLTAFLTGFNALVWSHGVMMMSGERSLRSLVKVLTSPAIIAIVVGMILFFFNITLPSLLSETFEMVGNLNTPLAMIVAGATIAQTDLIKVLRKPRVFYVAALKLLVIPLLCIVIFRFLPLDQTVEMTVLAASAAPSAAICTMMSLTYDRNAAYASEIFGMTTLLSVATMPVMMMAYGWIG